MLLALQKGVKGKVWFSLIDKVCAERTLQLAWKKCSATQGPAAWMAFNAPASRLKKSCRGVKSNFLSFKLAIKLWLGTGAQVERDGL